MKLTTDEKRILKFVARSKRGETRPPAQSFSVSVGETGEGFYLVRLYCISCDRDLGPVTVKGDGRFTQKGWRDSALLSDLLEKAHKHRCARRKS